MRWSGDWSLDVCSSDLMETIDFAAKHKNRHIGVFMLGSEIDCLHAGGARQPDRGMRLLNWARPDINVAIIVVLALKGKGARSRPGLGNQVMRLVHALATGGRIDTIAKIFPTSDAHKARDNASTTDDIQHRNLFSHAQWVIMQGQSIANYAYFGTFDALGKGSSHQIGRGHGAISVLVVFIHDHTIPA